MNLKLVQLQLLGKMKNIKMKRILILVFMICFLGALKAQQLPQITQYMNNNYLINPAIAGMYDYYQVNTTIRNQWAGMNQGPRTSVISIYGKHNNHVGLGGTVYNDVTGPTSRAGGSASYTYAFQVTKTLGETPKSLCIDNIPRFTLQAAIFTFFSETKMHFLKEICIFVV